MIERVSKRAFTGSSGTYHVRASELAVIRDRRLKVIGLTVVFLDGSTNVFTVEVSKIKTLYPLKGMVRSYWTKLKNL